MAETMKHLSEDQFYTVAFDQPELAAEFREHLATCITCQRELSQLQQFAGDLAFVRQITPSAAALARYRNAFEQVQVRPSRLQQLFQSVVATLTWDSRLQPALQGVRSGSMAGYRLLYTTAEAEIELLVEPITRARNIEGELIAADAVEETTPALISLTDQFGVVIYETETDEEGRFRFPHVAPDMYQLMVTSPGKLEIKVSALEIA